LPILNVQTTVARIDNRHRLQPEARDYSQIAALSARATVLLLSGAYRDRGKILYSLRPQCPYIPSVPNVPEYIHHRQPGHHRARHFAARVTELAGGIVRRIPVAEGERDPELILDHLVPGKIFTAIRY